MNKSVYFVSLFLPFLTKADVWLLKLINGAHLPFLDGVMQVLSNTWSWLPIFIWITCLLIRRMGKKAWYPILACIILVILTDQISSVIFKPLFHRLRPCWNPEINQSLYLVEGICKGKFGFISSHAANTMGFMVFSIIVIRSEPLKWCMLSLVILVGYSRIYLAVHYPFDVLFGWLLGVCMAQVMVYLYFKFLPKIQ